MEAEIEEWIRLKGMLSSYLLLNRMIYGYGAGQKSHFPTNSLTRDLALSGLFGKELFYHSFGEKNIQEGQNFPMGTPLKTA